MKDHTLTDEFIRVIEARAIRAGVPEVASDCELALIGDVDARARLQRRYDEEREIKRQYDEREAEETHKYICEHLDYTHRKYGWTKD